MKKILMTLFMSIVLLLTSITALAVESSPTEVGFSTTYNNVYIEGNIDSNSRPFLTVLLKDNNDTIKYIDQITAEADGSYQLKFKAPVDIDQCTLSVREGEKDVTESVKISKVQSAITVNTMKLTNDKNDWYFSSDQDMKALLEIENKYADETYSFELYIAGYDKDNNLVSAKKYPKTLGSNDLKIKLEQTVEDMPENTETVKVFAWREQIIPLAPSDSAILDKYIIGADKDEIVVALVGDSLTHHPNSYKMALEHYYMTRFPNKTITFVNKGIGGNGVDSLIGPMYVSHTPGGRFDNDVLNCEGVKPDIAIVMLGMNDNNYNYYKTDGDNGQGVHSGVDWHYNKFMYEFPLLLDKIQDNEIKAIVLSSSLLDEASIVNETTNYVCDICGAGANHTGLKRFAEFQKTECAKRGIPYVPINELTTSLDNEIRTAHPEQKLVFTSADRIHPSSYGADFVGYLVAEETVGNSLVAKVTINGTSVITENAVVSDVTNNGTTITYDYTPKSIPLAATTDYNTVVDVLGYDLTSKLNNEIICVKGLAAGQYEIKNGDDIIGTYSATELASGVNIAVAEKNPNQINAQGAWALLEQKDARSNEERYYYRSNKAFNETMISAVKEFRQQAKEASQPETWTVTITKK